ncbi:MAG: hypothetical protein WBB62_03490, partial [Rhodococcus sp. (in: high G+C Gram-positive bacteria)]
MTTSVVAAAFLPQASNWCTAYLLKPECTDELMCRLRVSLWRCDAGMGVGDRPTSVSGCSTGFFIL